MSDVKKLVSVIVPAFNVENYIDRCIESVLAQTYDNIELLVIDDGSSDDTWKHISKYAGIDARVKGFRRENSGVSATRNFAMEQAEGYYIEFVDADDYINKDAVETMVNAIEETGASWVNCQYNRLDEPGNKLENLNFTKGLKVTSTPEARFDLILNELADYFIGYEVWDKLFLASIIKDNNLRFDNNCKIGEDLAFNICYAFYADSINCIEDRIYNYLIRSDSAMGNAKSLPTNIKEHLALVKGIESQFNNVFTGELRAKFYQLFYKLMFHGFVGYTAPEALQVVREIGDDYFAEYLSNALRHRKEFVNFYRPEMANLYYRYGLYIDSYLKGDYVRKIYLAIYDVYRKLRGRETLREWRLT